MSGSRLLAPLEVINALPPHTHVCILSASSTSYLNLKSNFLEEFARSSNAVQAGGMFFSAAGSLSLVFVQSSRPSLPSWLDSARN